MGKECSCIQGMSNETPLLDILPARFFFGWRFRIYLDYNLDQTFFKSDGMLSGKLIN
jgi:hypothetical protein